MSYTFIINVLIGDDFMQGEDDGQTYDLDDIIEEVKSWAD